MKNISKSINLNEAVNSIAARANFPHAKPFKKRFKQQNFNINIESFLWLPDWHVYWKDIDGNFLGCNDAMAAGIKIPSRHAIVSQNDYDLPVSKNDADLFRQHDKQIIEKKLTLEFKEPQTLHGKNVVYQSIKIPLLNSDNAAVGVLGLSREIQFQNHYSNILQNQPNINLTAREKEIMHHIHKSAKHMAKALGISHRTVEQHIEKIKFKLNAKTKSELIEKIIDVKLF